MKPHVASLTALKIKDIDLERVLEFRRGQSLTKVDESLPRD